MTLHIDRPLTERFLLTCLLYLVVSPVHSYWINFVPDNFEWYAENTRSATPEGAAQRRCELQYSGTKPLDTLWYIETRDGRTVYGFTCGNLYTIPSYNTVRWYSCDLSGQAYSVSANGCVPVEEICGEGGYSYELGRCLNRNLGASSCRTKPLVGNPINAATGNKFQVEADIPAAGTPHLRFERFYNSLQRPHEPSLFGGKWRSNFDASIEVQHAWGMQRAVLHRPDGGTLLFELHHDKWVGPKNASLTLESTKDARGSVTGWLLTHAQGDKEAYDNHGRLVSLYDSQTQRTELAYDAQGKLTAARGPGERGLRFFYDNLERLKQVIDPVGHTFTYHYDAAGNLAEVIYPDDTPADDTDNPRRIYRYQDERHQSHLTSIIGERGNIVAAWAYDEKGRAVSSEHADGFYNHSLVFNADASTTVVTPLGHERTFRFSDQYGRKEIESTSGDQCSSCAGDSLAITYDPNGFVASQTDQNGNTTTFERDLLGRELSRIEAFGTPQARTISTTWHPEFGKPLTVTEPGRTTSYTYDSQGRMTSSSAQPQP